MIKKHDLTELDNSFLYERLKHSLIYRTKDSVRELKQYVDSHFIYNPEQWEYLEVEFTLDLEERYS